MRGITINPRVEKRKEAPAGKEETRDYKYLGEIGTTPTIQMRVRKIALHAAEQRVDEVFP